MRVNGLLMLNELNANTKNIWKHNEVTESVIHEHCYRQQI